MGNTYQLQLDENEVKLLVVAVKQVRNTFDIAEAQRREGGESPSGEYETVREMYALLEHRLTELMAGPPAETPFRIK